MEEITSEHLADKGNQTTCECGNITIHEYSWDSTEGDSTSCPSCMVEWMSEQIKEMKSLVYDLSIETDEKTALEINKRYAKIMGISIDDFNEDMDFS